MFLDPDPKRNQQIHRKRNSSAGFFSSQKPIESPRDSHGNIYARRKPLEELSKSQSNSRTPEPDPSSPTKPTVRIVKQSPILSAKTDGDGSDTDNAPVDENNTKFEASAHELSRLPEIAVVKPASVREPGIMEAAASVQDNRVSSAPASTNEAQTSDPGHRDNNALLVSTTGGPPSATWHRRSGSSGNFSTSSTLILQEGDSSIFGGSATGSRSRLSQGTTLRGTPTPYEQEHRERIEADDLAARSGSVQALQTLEEASLEPSTVRVVPASIKSESSRPELHSQPSTSSGLDRPQTSPSTGYNSRAESPTQRSSRRTSSTGSLPTGANIRNSLTSHHIPRNQSSQDSLAPSELSLPTASSPNFAIYSSDPSIPPSSPNFVLYRSDSSRPRSHSHPLHNAQSQESIDSRLRSSVIYRPETGSSGSLQHSSSNDTLPPLNLPRKRLRHKRSRSEGSLPSDSHASGSNMVTQDEIDTLPYPRYQYSSHLSTIASESDRNSRTSSQPLSHFSLGSGILTGDDSSSIPLSGNWSTRRRGSAPIESMVSSSQDAPGTSSG